MEKTLVKLPISATHSDGEGNVLICFTESIEMSNPLETRVEDHYVNLKLQDALLFMQELATAINDEFGHFNSVIIS